MAAKLYFRYSAMNAGKSLALLQVAHNYEEQQYKVALFTSTIDDRYEVGKITSRLGLQRDAELYSPETDFTALLARHRDAHCILIDEAEFATEKQVVAMHRFAHLEGIPVICYGIRSDFQGKAFPGSAALLTLADDIEELKTICACGRKATMNVRLDDQGQRVTEGSQVVIGGNENYRQVCPRCFYS